MASERSFSRLLMMRNTTSSTLFWSPIYSAITQKIEGGVDLSYIIAPYIKLGPLKKLIESCTNTENLSVISSWKEQNIVSGSTDIDIYPYLNELRIPLYSHKKIHLKLFVFKDKTVFHTSGNVSQRGLGLGNENINNIEVGCFLELNIIDLIEINKIELNSKRITSEDYKLALSYVEEHKKPAEPLPDLELTQTEQVFSLSSLPEVDNPQALYEKYANGAFGLAVGHDLATYRIPNRLDKDSFFKLLGENFRNKQFITHLVSYIQQKGEDNEDTRGKQGVNYGDIRTWIIKNCTDNPRPTKFELNEKQLINHLYKWLEFFYEEITWNVPGRQSEVIYWNRH
jgi:hypothetical protein